MNTIAHRQLRPTAEEAALARSSSQLLSLYAHEDRTLKLSVMDGEQERPIELPPVVVLLLRNILEAIASGRGVTIIPDDAELTTVQAADVLNVSRPYLIKLLDEKAIPHRKVGKHRRIRMEDVMAYKVAIDQEREDVLDQLTREAQEQAERFDEPGRAPRMEYPRDYSHLSLDRQDVPGCQVQLLDPQPARLHHRQTTPRTPPPLPPDLDKGGGLTTNEIHLVLPASLSNRSGPPQNRLTATTIGRVGIATASTGQFAGFPGSG